MNIKLLFYFGLFGIFLSPLLCHADEAPSPEQAGDALPALLSVETIRQEHYLPDFSFAGYRNGLSPLPSATGELIHVDEFGASADDDIDDTTAVQAAIRHAGTLDGPVVIRFAAGRYLISGILKLERSDIVLQGAGSGKGGTLIHFPRPLRQIDKSTSLDELRQYLRKLDKRQVEPERNINDFFSEYSWSGGFIWIQKPGTRPAPYLEEFDPDIDALTVVKQGLRGESRIELADTADIQPGDIIQIQWINRDGPEAGIIKSLYESEYRMAGSHHWSFPKRPLVRQTSRVTGVDGRVVTLSDSLLHNIDESIPAQIVLWDGLQNVGVEDLHLEFPAAPYFGHHLEEGYNGIYFTSAFDSWARNIRVTNADSGILSYNSANLTFSNITSEGTRPAHYAVHMGNVHNVLAEDVRVMNPVLHSLTFNTQSTKCVYKNAEVFVTPTLDQHAGSNHQNLYDNVTLHMPARAGKKGPVSPVFDGSGAGYWQPGHGAFNTTWNLRVLITGGAHPDETVTIQGLAEGPLARIVGLHGNRHFELDYRPSPYIEKLNVELEAVPSLYDYQLRERLDKARKPD